MKTSITFASLGVMLAASCGHVAAQLESALLPVATVVQRIKHGTYNNYQWLSASQVILTLPAGDQEVVYDTKSKSAVPLSRAQAATFKVSLNRDLFLKTRFQFWGTHRTAALPVRLVSQPPTNVFIEEATLSPDASRVVWILVTPKMAKAAGRATPTHGRQTSKSIIRTRALWISKADGTALHKLGDIDVHDPLTNVSLMVEWVPKSNLLSFVYHDVLYTVPVH